MVVIHNPYAIDMIEAMIEKYGIERKYHGYTFFHKFCMKGNLEMVKFLIDKGCNINERSRFGQTGFALACSRGHLDIMDYLAPMSNIDCGTYTDTPLMTACQQGNVEVVQKLLQLGANIEYHDFAFGNAIEIAAREAKDSERHQEILRLLTKELRDRKHKQIIDNNNKKKYQETLQNISFTYAFIAATVFVALH